MTSKNNKKELLIALLGAIFLCLFFSSTDPHNLSAGLLLVPPVLIFIILFALSKYVLKSLTEMSRKRLRLSAGVVAITPVLLLLFSSLGQLSLRDVVLILCLVFGLSAYLSRASMLSTGP